MKLYSFLIATIILTVSHAQNYKVKSGDSLGKIAQKHGMTTAELIRLNNIKDPNKLAVGQTLRVKGGAAVKITTGTHKVVSGDTFYKIAKTYGISIDQLKSLNSGVNPDRLSIGQVVRVSKSSPAQQPARPAPAPAQQTPQAQPDLAESTPQRPVTPQRPILRVVLKEPIPFKRFAALYGMTPEEVNKLNGWEYDEREVFDTGSTIFVIKN